MSAPRRAGEKLFAACGAVITGTIVVLVLAPVVLTVLLSFSNDAAIQFPPQSWGVQRYLDLAASTKWLTALWLSVRLALTSATIAFVLGVGALLAIHRTRLPLRSWLEQAGIVSLLIPMSAYSVAMYSVFSQLGLLGSFLGLALAHAVLALPFIILVGSASMRGVPPDLELTAITLGASRARAWGGITLRLVTPALAGGFVMAFQTSFEEAVFVNFLGGPGLVTLPKAIFDSVQFGSDPVITAISASIVLISSVAVALPLALTRGARR
ncbi:ABC transporter permease [Nocardiopsis ansamitocini]|uniref:ABC transporter permease n=1 Tax=Nocardiopsis ansamitocini TaxID=1670832 RepID=A0A9W6P7S9_9ACTN|nr:ABC transporter permease subunit [Nocardiopsis ansamitocini]GLU49090.1 ABC transporter permease [Nocardiopsis ansamitocini]